MSFPWVELNNTQERGPFCIFHPHLSILSYVEVHMSKEGPVPRHLILEMWVRELEGIGLFYAHSHWIKENLHFIWSDCFYEIFGIFRTRANDQFLASRVDYLSRTNWETSRFGQHCFIHLQFSHILGTYFNCLILRLLGRSFILSHLIKSVFYVIPISTTIGFF